MGCQRGKSRKRSKRPLLATNIIRKPRTKTVTTRVKKYFVEDVKEKNFWDAENLSQWITKKKFTSEVETKEIFPSSSSSSSSSNNASSYSLPCLSDIEIPGPIPDLDAIINDHNLLRNFFSSIPDIDDD